ncbi:SPOR domain-containing protein [Pacificimonas sp. WHA3]|uniref:SPOR domain-containing protein n=1 Tax=Pacificimonas pallii TaxID=2827236 RepID=A0ABS6SEC1_9SPHN|nr:SPOR domain-containing protein [Pacificimonas pallii]MBV7256762.1 SPOR domain-containing protein [Pacificimonas pallii]
MFSIGAKLAHRTIIATGGLLVTACATGQASPVVTLNNAVHTRALIEQASSRAAKMNDRFAAEAEAARLAGHLASAIQLAEQAIALDTNDEGARRTLATSYFAAGRFQSAAQAYADLLAMNPSAQTYKFGAALTALANGNEYRARALLKDLEDDPGRQGDVGLAYVLLGDMTKGTAMLKAAVQSGTSNARERQNLALAQALSGEWNAARVTAAMDLSPTEVDARVGEWAALAVSDDTAWRTAGLMKITPAAMDIGRPVQLAWSPPADDMTVQLAATDDAVGPASETKIRTVATAAPASVVRTSVPMEPRPDVINAAAPLKVAPRAPIDKAELASDPEAPQEEETATAISPTAMVDDTPTLPESGDGSWLVQLGAYDRLEWVEDNWQVLKTRNGFLARYRPVKSRTNIDGRDYYRLSVGRFETAGDAKLLCAALKSKGGSCFVREGNFKA